jgi:type I restriction enzyme S subunit
MLETNIRLNEVCQVIDCEHKTAPTQNEGFPLIRTPNIGKGQLILQNVQRVSAETYLKWTRRAEPQADDLIMAREAPVGNVAIIRKGQEVCLGQRTVLIKVISKEIYPRYLNYLLSSNMMHTYLNVLSNGATVGHLNVSDIRNLKIPQPPKLANQKKIAAILSAYDDLIENNKRRITLLENMAEEIYREWFVRFRFPNYKNAEFEKGIPKGWEVSSLGKIANIQMGQSPKSEFYNTQGEGLPFHQGVGSYGNRFPINDTYCSVEGRVANEGEILFSVRAPVGRINIANTKMIIGRGLAALSHKKGFNTYLLYLLKLAFADEDIIGNGSIFNSVGKDELNNFKLFLPPEHLIALFEKIASPIDTEIKLLLQSQENLEKTKSMLLPRLISGKLTVENLNIQFLPSMEM